MKTEEDSKISLLMEDLSSLEEYINSLFSFFPLPICFVSPLGIILEDNSVFEKVSNFSEGEAIGEQVDNLFKKEEIARIIEETLKKGFIEGREIEFSPKHKNPFFVQVFTKTRKDREGRTIGFFLSFFDLTGVKKAENELKRTQVALLNILEDTEEARRNADLEKNKTLTVINNFSDGLLVFDKENNLLLINPRAERFLGLESGKVLNKPASELIKFPGFKKLTDLIGFEIKGVFRKEMVLKERLILEISTTPMIFQEEKTGTLVILHDITREKMVERIKTEFVSVAAHQLRTPLSAVKWTLKMFLDEDLGEISEEQKGFLEKTYQSNERMISLINDLLDVTRIEEGRYLFNPISADFKDIVRSVLDPYLEEATRRKVGLNVNKIKTRIPKVNVDVEKIRIVIQNLLDNALKYTPAGGKVDISLDHDKKKKEIIFSVKDTGVGIPQDQQPRVFSKFFRGANVMRMETEGSGLGVFIGKNIIEAHGGKIWFESEEGKGTTFYFSLPLKEEFTEFLKNF